MKLDTDTGTGGDAGELYHMKVHMSPDGAVVAICDRELMGRVLREGRLKLDIREGFYGDRLVTLPECLEMLGHCMTANIVGNRIVSRCIEAGMVDEEMVIHIQDIAHAQMLCLPL